MNKEYVINHLNIGLFIKELMDKTSIYSIEIDISEEKLLFFPSFVDSECHIVEWYEKPQIPVISSYFSEKESIFISEQQTLPEFTKFFFKKFPIAQNNDFLTYLSEFMKKDIEGDFSYSFYKNSLGDNINDFWGNNIKAFLLYNKLNKELDITFTERLNKI
jgi:hypothetical protein